ncbi:MAG: S8/S53 family peptidase, partial [Bdellovibrionales bacterium]|nr:S8/S53 family peptidase [Bdellovibrionales bacterium]
TDDKFLVVIGEVEGQWLAYSDFDQSSQFEMNEGPFNDFNKARNQSVEIFQNGLFVFPNRNKTVSYPLLININAEAKPESIELGIDFENHGTHVAGIAGGNGEQIRGAAPETKFMALKVCTGVTCTTAAILRALVEAFYNPQGLVPDVVNISLGSHEGYEQDVFNYLMRDLASKFGTIFFISASNDGIGYRSINSIGSFGPVVSVGAHVSKDSLEKLYNLAPGVEAPLNSLLFFSSVGPSYTGQLRPNIVAPGAALSSLPLIGGGSALYNGTSMSSPISAGAASALLSLYKKTDGYAEWAKAREEKIKDIQNGGDGTVGGSLMKYPLALRTSLEETAEKMPYYTTAQQGHGLINIPRAFEHLTALQKSVDSDSTLFFDVEINSSAKNNRLYDRSVNIADVKTVGLSQEFDGELNEEKRLLIQNHTFEVRLERVEVQDTNGAVTTLTNDLPFAMSQGRGDGTARRSIPIVLSNNYKKLFYSVRNLSAMEEGKTYVAVYGLYDGATRVFTLLDVVHKPILLTTELKTHYLPGIESNAFKRSASFSKAGVDIKANEFHRYPIAVTAQDSQVNLDVALHPNAYGNLYVQVYDQDGSEIYFGQLNSDPQHPTESRKISVQLDVEEAGIYEVAFSAGNRAWMGPTKYDFIAGVSRFKASVERLDFDLTGKSEDKKTIALTDSSNQITDITLSSLDLVPMVEIKNVPVKPAHWTYVKVDPPKFVKNNSVWIVSVADDKKVDQSYFGRVDERLYVRKPNGDYEPVESALPQASSGTRKVFTDVDFEGKEIYAALETIDVVPESDGLKGALKKLTLDVIFPGNESTVAMQTSLRTEGGFYFIDVNVSRGSTKPNGVTYMGVIEVETNDERTGLEVPVKVRL